MKTSILFVCVFAFIAIAAASTCGGNCPGGCNSCDCGSSPNDVSISQYCSKYSDWSQSCCECIASHESGGNANAENQNTNGSYDIGLFQINDTNWSSCSSGSPPCDPNTNTYCAHMVFGWGHNTWTYWSTCGVCGCCDKA
mmetsp:Transcript_44208/g.67758  ORF Transcript_44208/g.67758 Transcript_44208/m.67758 type:complete len:140 (+) Transcript_44208:52-471(+)